jgi:hypothetical protein
MSVYFKLFVVIILGTLLSLLIFPELSSFSFTPDVEHHYPIGSFEVHAFFEQHWHSL